MRFDTSDDVYHVPNNHTKCPVCCKRRERYMIYNHFYKIIISKIIVLNARHMK